MYDKLGELLKEKISEEEHILTENNSNLLNEAKQSENFQDKNKKSRSTQTEKISEKMVLEALENKKNIGQLFHEGQFVEDVPVKIIPGEVEFK